MPKHEGLHWRLTVGAERKRAVPSRDRNGKRKAAAHSRGETSPQPARAMAPGWQPRGLHKSINECGCVPCAAACNWFKAYLACMTDNLVEWSRFNKQSLACAFQGKHPSASAHNCATLSPKRRLLQAHRTLMRDLQTQRHPPLVCAHRQAYLQGKTLCA